MKIILDIIANFVRVLFESRTSRDRNNHYILIRILMLTCRMYRYPLARYTFA